MILNWISMVLAAGGESLSTAGGHCAARVEDRDAWFEAAGETVTLPFRDLAEEGLVFVTDQYQDQGVLFTDGDDWVDIFPALYPNDGVGLNGFESTITAVFDPPIYWTAIDTPPGCRTLRLYSGDRQILATGSCACSETACFVGAGSTVPVDKIVIFEPAGCPCIDDLHFSRTPITIDCNGNGVPDLIEIRPECSISADCNGNLVPDECDVASGIAEDCDANGVLDECEIAAFHSDHEENIPFGGPGGPTLVFSEQPAASSDVEIAISLSADLDGPFEYIISVEFDGVVFGEMFFVEDGLLCADPPQQLHFTIAAKQYNAFIEDDGILEVKARPTGTVDPFECDPSFVAAELSYFTLVETDLNYNGIPDACEGAPGDIDGDGDVDFSDLLTLLDAWGDCPPGEFCPADVDGSGAVGFADLVLLLSNWS